MIFLNIKKRMKSNALVRYLKVKENEEIVFSNYNIKFNRKIN